MTQEVGTRNGATHSLTRVVVQGHVTGCVCHAELPLQQAASLAQGLGLDVEPVDEDPSAALDLELKTSASATEGDPRELQGIAAPANRCIH